MASSSSLPGTDSDLGTHRLGRERGNASKSTSSLANPIVSSSTAQFTAGSNSSLMAEGINFPVNGIDIEMLSPANTYTREIPLPKQ